MAVHSSARSCSRSHAASRTPRHGLSRREGPCRFQIGPFHRRQPPPAGLCATASRGSGSGLVLRQDCCSAWNAGPIAPPQARRGDPGTLFAQARLCRGSNDRHFGPGLAYEAARTSPPPHRVPYNRLDCSWPAGSCRLPGAAKRCGSADARPVMGSLSGSKRLRVCDRRSTAGLPQSRRRHDPARGDQTSGGRSVPPHGHAVP